MSINNDAAKARAARLCVTLRIVEANPVEQKESAPEKKAELKSRPEVRRRPEVRTA